MNSSCSYLQDSILSSPRSILSCASFPLLLLSSVLDSKAKIPLLNFLLDYFHYSPLDQIASLSNRRVYQFQRFYSSESQPMGFDPTGSCSKYLYYDFTTVTKLQLQRSNKIILWCGVTAT